MSIWKRWRGFTASVTVHDGPAVRLGSVHTRQWQHTAWDFWGRLGELHYPTSQIARLVGKLKWRVFVDGRELNRDPDSFDETDQFLERVTEPMEPSEAIRLIALNYQVAGELWYINQGQDDGWIVASITEPDLRQMRENEQFLKLRAMVRDPRDRRFADSPFQAVIGPAEELLTLEALSRSQSRSRLSQAGILLRPNEAEWPETNPDGSPANSFGEDLERAMTAPIHNEYDPSALVPMDVEVPGETIDQFRHMTFGREYDDKLHERIERATSRIAVGLDIPAELLLGIADLNHWNAWLVQEETYTSHTEPLANQVAELLAEAGQAIGIGRDIEVRPDPTDLLARRSTVRDAFDAARLGAVGLPFVREAIGATEEDKPTDEDLAIMQGQQTGGGGQPAPPNEGGGLSPERAGDRPGPPAEEGTPVAAVVEGNGQSELPALGNGHKPRRPLIASTRGATDPDADLEEMGRLMRELDASLRDRLVGAIEMALDNGLRKVGAKVRTSIRNTGEHDQIADVENRRVPIVMATRTFELVDVEGSLRDSFGDVVDWWAGLVDDAREKLADITGVDTESSEWEDAKERSVEFLRETLVEWASADIQRGERSPNERLTIADMAREAVAYAGGSA